MGILGLLVPELPAQTVSFGTFSIDFVGVGDAGNADDDTGYGGVPYAFQIGKYEVSREMIEQANTAGGLGLTMADMTVFGGNGVDRPATGISWNEAARFVNWLNISQGFQLAYQFTTQPGEVGYDASDSLALWSSGDAWQLGGENLFRHKDAHYFLPSEDEWYKAAYYDPGTSGYWDYATGSDTAPTAVSGGTATGTVVYDGQTGPADITDAGGLSPFGSMAQNGNALEWIESGFTAPNDSAEESRALRGGAWSRASVDLRASVRGGSGPALEGWSGGFRVAAVPEPSVLGLGLVGAIALMIRRRR